MRTHRDIVRDVEKHSLLLMDANRRLRNTRRLAIFTTTIAIAAALLAAVDAFAYGETYYPEHDLTVPPVAAPYHPSAMDFIGAPNGGWK